MLRFLKSSVALQYAVMTIAFIFLSAAVIVGVMHHNLRNYVLQDATNDARDATRSMAVLYGAAVADAKIALRDGALGTVTAEAMPHYPLDAAFAAELPPELIPAWEQWRAGRSG